MFYSSLTGNCQREQIVSTEAHGLSPKRKRLEDVTTAPYSAIHNNVDAVADGINDFRKLFKGGAGTIKLPAPMIGKYNAGAPDLDRPLCVFYRHHTLEAELTVPFFDHLSDILP